MKKQSAYAAAAAAAVLIAAPALAVQITNGDAEPRIVEVYQGDDVIQVTLAAGETRQDLCPSGCSLLTDDSALDKLQGSETVMIRNGRLELQR